MNELIQYQNWPEHVKITTALSNKKFLITNYNINLGLGYFLLIIAVIGTIFCMYQSEDIVMSDILESLAFGIIGLVNVIAGYSSKWISRNSSWEERFEHKSSGFHKALSIVITVILFAALYVILTS